MQNIMYLTECPVLKVRKIYILKHYKSYFLKTVLRHRIKRFGIANYESFFICSESKTAFPQLFHEP